MKQKYKAVLYLEGGGKLTSHEKARRVTRAEMSLNMAMVKSVEAINVLQIVTISETAPDELEM